MEYALERVTFGTAQVRLGTSLTIGALDKIGLFPLLIGAGLFLYKWWKDPLFSFNLSMVGVAGGVVLVYLASISHFLSTRRLDYAALALKQAIEAKKFSESSGSADTPS